jgi:hypothetical protein
MSNSALYAVTCVLIALTVALGYSLARQHQASSMQASVAAVQSGSAPTH